MNTESKLAALRETFPDFEVCSLLDILVSCDGSVKKAKCLLLGEEYNEVEDEVNEEKPQKEEIKKDCLGNKFGKSDEDKALKIVQNCDPMISDEVSLNEDIMPQKENQVDTISIDYEVDGESQRKRRFSEDVGPQNGLSKIAKFPKIDPNLTNKTITLYTKQEIETALPNVRIFSNFLSESLADECLESLMQQKLLFKAKQFYIAGNLCTSSQMSVCFGDSGKMDIDPVYQNDNSKSVKPSPSLMKCTAYVNDIVNTVLEEVYGDDNADKPHYLVDRNWRSDYCIGNYFPNNKSHLDWHSDKLTNIGPMPTIASISLGARRIFRLRRSAPSNSAIYNIPLSHNTLLIMLPTTQELFKHCVPTLKDSLLKQHPKVGESRFSLTFRMEFPAFQNKKVFCDLCKSQMILRRLFKGEDIGYYIWQCMSAFRGKQCKGFKFAKFDDLSKSAEFATTDKIMATRWISPLEKGYMKTL